MSHAALGEWRPFSLDEVRAVLARLPVPWWIAGSFALELFAGRSWRAHGDIDAGIFRDDQRDAFAELGAWELHAAADGELTRLRAGELVPADASLWCRADARGPWRFQLLLDLSEGSDWVFRRDPAVRVPRAELVRRSANGLPYLRPDIQLLYKAKSPRPKDEEDFAVVAPLLDPAAREWLRAALTRVHPGHPWLAKL